MSKGSTRLNAIYYSSRKTIKTTQGVIQIERDGDGDYLIRDEGADVAIYLGKADDAEVFHAAMDSLLSENDEA